MAHLFSGSLKSQPSSFCCFHCQFISCRSVSPKSSQRLQFCNAIPCFAKRWVTHHTHVISKSNEPSVSSSNSVSEDFDIVSTTECSDGSIVYRFGNISEIMENMVDVDQEKLPKNSLEEGGKISTGALLSEDVEKLDLEGDSDESHRIGSNNTEVGHISTGEIDSFSMIDLRSNTTVLSEDADKESQPPANEVKNLEFDLVKEGKHENYHEDVVSEVQDIPSVSEENSEVSSHIGVVVPTISPESSVPLDLFEEGKHDNDHEDVVSEVHDVPSVSGENSEINSNTEVVVSIVTPEFSASSNLVEKEKHENDHEEAVSNVQDIPGEIEENSEINSQGVVVPEVTPDSGVSADLVDVQKHESDHEDVDYDVQDVSSVSEENSEVNSLTEVVVPTFTPDSGVSPDLEEEKHENHDGDVVSKVQDIPGEVEENSEVNKQGVVVPTVTSDSGVSPDLVEEKHENHDDVVSKVQAIPVEVEENSEVNSQGVVVPTVTSDSVVSPDLVEEKHENHDDVVSKVQAIPAEVEENSEVNSQGVVVPTVPSDSVVSPDFVEEKHENHDDVVSKVQDIPGEVEENSEVNSQGVVVPEVTPKSGLSADLIEVEKHESDHGDVVSGVQDVSSVSEEDPEINGHTGVVVPTVTPDLLEVEKHEINHEDVATEVQDVPITSGESSEVKIQMGEVAPTVTPESSVSPDFNVSALGIVEEKNEANEGNVIDTATNNPADDAKTDVAEMVAGFSLDSEPVLDEETSHHIVAESVDANKKLDELAPSFKSEDEIVTDKTRESDYEGPSNARVSEMHSTETVLDEEKILTTGLFLTSGVASLPHPSKALAGREDAYFISCKNWLGVADGVGQWSFEGNSNAQYSRELMEKCENTVSNHKSISLIKPEEVLRRSAGETGYHGSSTALVAHFDGQTLHAANVGDTGFIILRNGAIFKKSTPAVHEFSFPLQIVRGDDPSEIIEGYKIDLHEGDVIVAATDGLFDNLYDEEIAIIVSKSLQSGLKPQEIAEFLAMKAQEVGRSPCTRSPFADAAQAAGYVACTGGKLDHVTVIVSFVHRTSSSPC